MYLDFGKFTAPRNFLEFPLSPAKCCVNLREKKNDLSENPAKNCNKRKGKIIQKVSYTLPTERGSKMLALNKRELRR